MLLRLQQILTFEGNMTHIFTQSETFTVRHCTKIFWKPKDVLFESQEAFLQYQLCILGSVESLDLLLLHWNRRSQWLRYQLQLRLLFYIGFSFHFCFQAEFLFFISEHAGHSIWLAIGHVDLQSSAWIHLATTFFIPTFLFFFLSCQRIRPLYFIISSFSYLDQCAG